MSGPPDHDEIDRLPHVQAAFHALGDAIWQRPAGDPGREELLKLNQGAVAKLTLAKLKIRLLRLSVKDAADELAAVVVTVEQVLKLYPCKPKGGA